METLFDIPIFSFKDSEAWEVWLARNYMDETGVWLKIAKKDSGFASITYAEALDACLCYGWIDGQRRSYDGTHFMQKYTPRRKKSLWSKVNIGKVKVLEAAGRMKEPGQKAIDEAKADGRWDRAYESQANAVIPPDLESAFASSLGLKEYFESLNSVDRYHILFQLMTASTPTLREARLKKLLNELESKR